MVAAVRNEIERSCRTYPECSQASWVLELAGQVALCVAMIYWTAEVQHVLSLQQLQALTEYYERLQVNVAIFDIVQSMQNSYQAFIITCNDYCIYTNIRWELLFP
jgi:hypothetical protein